MPKLSAVKMLYTLESAVQPLFDPTGPAAKTELVVGDVVTAVDGIELTAVPLETAWTLISVTAGAPIRLRLARGVTVTMVAISR